MIISGGAGADGKTTIIELLAKYSVLQGTEPLLVDANPDQNLANFLGVPENLETALPKICEHWERLRDLLEGDNPDYPFKGHIVDVSPLTPHSVRWNASAPDDPVLSEFSVPHKGMRFMHTGTYEAEDIGAGCLHDKIGPLTFILNHMQDGNGADRLTMVDNAHGRDAFGTPLYALGDAILIVARPEKKSVDILRDYLAMAGQVEKDIGFPIPVIVVGNRLSSDPEGFQEDMEYLRGVAGDKLVTGFVEDRAFNRRRSNKGPDIHEINHKNLAALEKLHEKVLTASRDYNRRREWIALCLDRSGYLDKLVDPSVRGQKSDFVPLDQSTHGHGGGHTCGSVCNHHRHEHS